MKKKLKQMIKNITGYYKQAADAYPITLVLIFLFSVTAAVFIDQSGTVGKFVEDKGIPFLMLWGFGTFFAETYGCVVVLKDHVTCVAPPDGKVYMSTAGNAGLARGGSGDTLAGMIASFLAQGYPPLEAALCGVHLHGSAADRCVARLSQYGMLPSDILTDLCGIFLERGL